MSKILSKELVVIAAIVMVVASGMIVNLTYANNSTVNANKLSRKTAPGTQFSSSNIAEDSPFYLTSNLTIQNGTSYIIKNEHVVVQSLSLTSITIHDMGSLIIINSSISLSREPYSKITDINICATNGSFFDLENSSIVVPGALTFDNSAVRIENSIIDSSGDKGLVPAESALTMQVNNSTMNMVNSSINGLYRQNSAFEYTDGQMYLYESGFSQNAIVPVRPSFNLKNKSYINSVNLSVTYYGNTNETNDSLEVYYNNSYIESLPLPYSTNQSSRVANFTLNFTGPLHNLTWMENSTNFRLVANISYYSAIALSNLTENIRSNDTVDLYGQQYFSYFLRDSTLFVYNSSLGLNQKPLNFLSGEPDYGKLSLISVNSSLYFGDISIDRNATYSSPFFILTNSSVYLFREIVVQPSYKGVSYNELNFSIFSAKAGGGYAVSKNVTSFNHTLNHFGDGWLANGMQRAVLYDTTNDGLYWDYLGQFDINATPGTVLFSADPYPSFSNSVRVVNYTSPVPYAVFPARDNMSGFNGSITVGYTGNLSGLKDVSVHWTLFRNQTEINSGSETIYDPGLSNALKLNLNKSMAAGPGSYNFTLKFDGSSPHAFSNSGIVYAIFSKNQPASRNANVTVAENGLSKGVIWGLKVGNTEYYSNGTALNFSINRSLSVVPIVPNGYYPGLKSLEVNFNATKYTISFHRTLYNVTFENSFPKSGLIWGVIVDGHQFTTRESNITVLLPPGNYNYEIVDPTGYHSTNSTGIISISGSPLNLTVVSSIHSSVWSLLAERLASPQYYVPISFFILFSLALMIRNAYHTWYLCEKCGVTRKKKRDKCPYCGA